MNIIRSSQLQFEPASHENPLNPGVLKKVLARKPDFMTGQIQMINWAQMPVGKEFAAHYHEDMQEVFIILSGKAHIWISGEENQLEIGDAVFIPSGAIHSMRNISDCDLEYLAIGISGYKNGKTVVI